MPNQIFDIVYNESDARVCILLTQQHQQLEVQLLDSDNKKVELTTIAEQHKTYIQANKLQYGKYKILITGKKYDISVYNQIQCYVYEQQWLEGSLISPARTYNPCDECLFLVTNYSPLKKIKDFYECEVEYSDLLPKVKLSAEFNIVQLALLQKEGIKIKIQDIYLDIAFHRNEQHQLQNFENQLQIKDFHFKMIQFNQLQVETYKQKFNVKSANHTIHSIDIKQFMRLGHRGCGSNKNYEKGCNPIMENSLDAFKIAKERIHGSELDIVFTNDQHAVINHDFSVVTELGSLRVYHLSLEQFKQLNSVRLHSVESTPKSTTLRQYSQDYDNELANLYVGTETDLVQVKQASITDKLSQRSSSAVSVSSPKRSQRIFGDQPSYNIISSQKNRPTIKEALKAAGQSILDIEVKYPSRTAKDLSRHYIARSEAIHIIFQQLQYGSGNYFFSTFDPIMAYVLAKSQNIIPVFFLNGGYGDSYESEDIDSDLPIVSSFKKGADFAFNSGFVGMVTSSALVKREQDSIPYAISKGLKILTWGTVYGDNDEEKHHQQLGISGIIYDLILRAQKK